MPRLKLRSLPQGIIRDYFRETSMKLRRLLVAKSPITNDEMVMLYDYIEEEQKAISDRRQMFTDIIIGQKDKLKFNTKTLETYIESYMSMEGYDALYDNAKPLSTDLLSRWVHLAIVKDKFVQIK